MGLQPLSLTRCQCLYQSLSELGMHRAAMEIHLSFKEDSNLLNLNVIMLHSDVVEAVMFRLFYFDSNGESFDTL